MIFEKPTVLPPTSKIGLAKTSFGRIQAGHISGNTDEKNKLLANLSNEEPNEFLKYSKYHSKQ